MLDENVQIVQQIYEATSATLELPGELFTAAFELDVSDVDPDSVGVANGVKAAEAVMRPYWETFDGFHVEIEEVIHADGERVVDAVRDGGRLRGTDAQVTNRFFHVWSVRDGKITRLSIHTERTRALRAAGLWG